MPLRTIYISVDPIGMGKRHWFVLYIHKTAAELQRYAKRYSGCNEQHPKDFWDDCYGCFQPRFAYKVEKGKTVRIKNTPFIGVMRLCEERLNHDVMVHESVHAAINLVRALLLDVNFDLHKIDNEEALAYSTQHISMAVIKACSMEQLEEPQKWSYRDDESQMSA